MKAPDVAEDNQRGWGMRWRRRWRGGRPGEGEGPRQGEARGRLSEATPGMRCRVVRVGGSGPLRQRLLDLGIRPGREITVVRNALLFDPIEIAVGDGFVAVRRKEAAEVEIEDA